MNQEVSVNKENYRKFMDFASQLSNEGGMDETYTFDFEGLIRMVDVAFLEGRLTEATENAAVVDDPDIVAKIDFYNSAIEKALDRSNEGFPTMEGQTVEMSEGIEVVQGE